MRIFLILISLVYFTQSFCMELSTPRHDKQEIKICTPRLVLNSDIAGPDNQIHVYFDGKHRQLHADTFCISNLTDNSKEKKIEVVWNGLWLTIIQSLPKNPKIQFTYSVTVEEVYEEAYDSTRLPPVFPP